MNDKTNWMLTTPELPEGLIRTLESSIHYKWNQVVVDNGVKTYSSHLSADRVERKSCKRLLINVDDKKMKSYISLSPFLLFKCQNFTHSYDSHH